MGDRQMFPVQTAMTRYGLDAEFMKLSMRAIGLIGQSDDS
jgi:hypothetical protein